MIRRSRSAMMVNSAAASQDVISVEGRIAHTRSSSCAVGVNVEDLPKPIDKGKGQPRLQQGGGQDLLPTTHTLSVITICTISHDLSASASTASSDVCALSADDIAYFEDNEQAAAGGDKEKDFFEGNHLSERVTRQPALELRLWCHFRRCRVLLRRR